MSQSDEGAVRKGLNLFLSLVFWSSKNGMSDPVRPAKLDIPSISCLSSWLNWEATNLSSALQSVTFDNSFSLLMLSDVELCFFIIVTEGLCSSGSCITSSACINLVSFLYNKFSAEILFRCGFLNIRSIGSSYVYLRSHPSILFVWPLVLFLNALHTTHPSSCTHSIICWKAKMRLSLSLQMYYVWLPYFNWCF